MLKKKIILLAAFIAISAFHTLHAQTADSLALELEKIKARLDSIESKGRFLVDHIKNNQQLTKKNIESDFYGGVVFSNSNTRINIGGLLKTNFTRDFREMNATNYFAVSQIPADNGSDNKYAMDVGSSRFYINSFVNTSNNLTFKTKFEFDFFNTSGNMSFRIRHAYAEIGRFGVGKTYSNFTDPAASADILDNGGGPGEMSGKQIQLSYRQPITANFMCVLALEESNATIYDNNDTNFATNTFPDAVANLKYKFGKNNSNHIKAAAVIHPISYYDNKDKRTTEFGLGANLTGCVYLLQGDYIDCGASYSDGVSKYYNDPATPFDARINNENYAIETQVSYGGFLYYHRSWSDFFASNVGYNFIATDENGFTLPTDEKQGHYFSANLIYYPMNKIALGAEYIFGLHKDVSGEKGNNSRIQVQALFTF